MVKQISYKIAVCDFCGKEENFQVPYSFPYNTGWRVVSIDEASDNKRYELCPDCIEKMKNFIQDSKRKKVVVDCPGL